jgi:hypothetical protein
MNWIPRKIRRIALAAIGILFAALVMSSWMPSQVRADPTRHQYNPAIDPNDFVAFIDNKYFSLAPGTKFTYEKEEKEGIERIEVIVTHETREIMGVTTTVVRDRQWFNGELLEDTRDWYAQDKYGNVWYFGEAVDHYRKGKLKHHKESWEAGVNGAKPGIIMPKDPKVGDSYRQEYHKGTAEDMATVVAVRKEVAVPSGVFEGCLQIRNWSPIDRSDNEYKYYCPDVSFVVIDEEAPLIRKERAELVGFAAE